MLLSTLEFPITVESNGIIQQRVRRVDNDSSKYRFHILKRHALVHSIYTPFKVKTPLRRIMSDAAYTLNDIREESHLTKLALTGHIDDTAVCNHISLAFACASEALSASEHVVESGDRGYHSIHYAHIWVVLVNESSYMVE
jgi:hypothetical protein